MPFYKFLMHYIFFIAFYLFLKNDDDKPLNEI